MDEFEVLIKKGNIGIYNSCEVTELVIIEDKDIIYNLYSIVVFQEKRVDSKKHKYDKGLCNRIEIDEKHSIGIFQYELKLNEIKENFEKLYYENKWISNHKDELSIKYSDLKRLNKQFIPANEKSRINCILKNNFYSGSYIIEFFDEEKNFRFLTDDEINFERISKKIQKKIHINLYQIRDRLGNFIFQFPVNILNVKTSASDSEDSLIVNVRWHSLFGDNYPDCFLEVDSILDKNYMSNNFEKYNKKDSHEIYLGNIDALNNIKFWRKDPNLLLYSCSGYYIKSVAISMSLDVSNKRYFTNNEGKKEVINLQSQNYNLGIEKQDYYQFIENSLNIKERELLEESLSFKQYTPKYGKLKGLKDLRRLIKENGHNGVYLWDPYLGFKEIIDTLFHCPYENVELRALGSVNDNVSKIYFNNYIKNEYQNMAKKVESASKDSLTKNELKMFISSLKEDIVDINNYLQDDTNLKRINNEKKLFSNLDSDFKGLNLVFRVQIGNEAHDRFLIFPGNSKNYEQPKVYSLGTSVNSFGRNYHILQEVSYPQAVLHEFNKIWNKSNKPENLIWTYPN